MKFSKVTGLEGVKDAEYFTAEDVTTYPLWVDTLDGSAHLALRWGRIDADTKGLVGMLKINKGYSENVICEKK